MADFLKNNSWKGWRLVEVPTAAGGAQARAARRVREKHKRQLEVLGLIEKSRPDVLVGTPGVSISNSQVNTWQEQIEEIDSDSVYALRDRLNFLTRGLAHGQKMLRWDVSVPAPLTITHNETSPFTPDSFAALKEFRSWQQKIGERLESGEFLSFLAAGNNLQGHRRLEAESISWGLVLYYSITVDGLLDQKAVNSLSIFSGTLTLSGNDAWIELFDTLPEGLKRVPPRRRWMPSAPTVGLMLRHASRHGYPAADDYKDAKIFVQRAWRQFHRACGIEPYPISSALQAAALALRLHTPSYLVNDAQGRSSGTALSPVRWQQLISGGARKVTQTEAEKKEISDAPLRSRKKEISLSLRQSRQVLSDLKDKLYKRKSQLRLTFLEKSQAINSAIEKAAEASPIVELVCLWIRLLHRKKLKQSTLYAYLNRIGFCLLQSLGDEQVDPDHIDLLRKAYEEIIDSAVSQKDRSYKLGLLRQFHDFLAAELGIPQVLMDEFGPEESAKQPLADANLISEVEFECIAQSLLCSGQGELAKARYWIFVLGYRAGLRASEASSIQLRDIQLPGVEVHDSVFFLFIRPNRFVDTKSFDSRRQLPLHLLLSSQERNDFERFIRERYEMLPNVSAMLFSSQGDAVRPIEDSEVYPAIHRAMRSITGDPTLRYHHLRHSLANHLLVIFHGISVPYPTPSHLKPLLSHLSQGVTRKGLYFISQVLGHVAPDTTLQSYVHCQSLLLQHFLKSEENMCQLDPTNTKPQGLAITAVEEASRPTTRTMDGEEI